jgi:hypothetical protein
MDSSATYVRKRLCCNRFSPLRAARSFLTVARKRFGRDPLIDGIAVCPLLWTKDFSHGKEPHYE